MARTDNDDLLLRIIVTAPPPGVQFRLQRGSHDLEPAVHTTPAGLTFEFPVRVATRSTGEPNLLGAVHSGPPAGRFVYINSGTLAGQAGSCWSRRAKIPLTSITWTLIDKACTSGVPPEAEIAGTGRDGGPSCASVPLRGSGWRVASRS